MRHQIGSALNAKMFLDFLAAPRLTSTEGKDVTIVFIRLCLHRISAVKEVIESYDEAIRAVFQKRRFVRKGS